MDKRIEESRHEPPKPRPVNKTRFRCVCGLEYQRKVYFTKHIQECQKVPVQDAYVCSCATLYTQEFKDAFIAHLQNCGKRRERRLPRASTHGENVVAPPDSKVIAVQEPVSSPGSNSSKIGELGGATPGHPTHDAHASEIVSRRDRSCIRDAPDPQSASATTSHEQMPCHAADVGSEVEGGHLLLMPTNDLSPFSPVDSNTKSWVRGLKVPSILKDNQKSQSASFDPGLDDIPPCSAGGSSPDEEFSIATDSDLLSISDASDAELSVEVGPLSPLQSRILNRIMLDYEDARRCLDGARSANRSGNVYATPVSSASTSSTTSSASKRKLGDRDSIGEAEAGPCAKVAKQAQPDEIRPKVLACPYWKRDSEKHRVCCKLSHKRIRDVKQHLHRRHTPENYCDRCLEMFEDGDRYEVHLLRAVACFRVPGTQLEGITRTQSRALNKKSDRKLDEEGQWFAMWDILFPGMERPSSAYLDSDLTEEMNSFQEYMTNRGQNILLEELNSNNMWCLSVEEREVQGSRILARGLHLIYEQWAAIRRTVVTTPPQSAISTTPPFSGSIQSTQSPVSMTSSVPAQRTEPEGRDGMTQADRSETNTMAREAQGNGQDLRGDRVVAADPPLMTPGVTEGLPPSTGATTTGHVPLAQEHVGLDQFAFTDVADVDFPDAGQVYSDFDFNVDFDS